MHERRYELDTTGLYGHDLAVFVCEHCLGEWLINADYGDPEYCPYCGET